MSDSLDHFVESLQAEIDAQALADYGEEAFRRWKAPRCMFEMTDPDARGRVTGPCGDTMEIFLKFENGRVKKASFTTTGCGPSAICGSFGVEAAIGRQLEDLADITGETILQMAGGLPEDSVHCAFLTADALRAALENYVKNDDR